MILKIPKDYVTNQQPNCEVIVVQRQGPSQAKHVLQKQGQKNNS